MPRLRFKKNKLGLFAALFLSLICVSCSETSAQHAEPQTFSEDFQDELPAGPIKLVTLRASDPRVKFTDISSPWREFQAKGLDTSELTYQVAADEHGYECEIEYLRLYTSNKAVIVPGGNICENSSLEIDVNWPEYKGEVMTLSDKSFRWMQHSQPPTEAYPFDVEVLSYSIPESDEIVMSLHCTRGSKDIQMRFEAAAIDFNPVAKSPNINLISNDLNDPYVYRFASKWEHIDIEDRVLSFPVVYDQIDHSFFPEFENPSGFDLIVEDLDRQVFRIDTSADKEALQKFVGLCGGEGVR